jgi:hypothetical protein
METPTATCAWELTGIAMNATTKSDKQMKLVLRIIVTICDQFPGAHRFGPIRGICNINTQFWSELRPFGPNPLG